jgi:hypothetical protein
MTERDQPNTPSESADNLDTEPSMTQHPDPTADPTADPMDPVPQDPSSLATPDPTSALTADPVGDPTMTIETAHTQAVPAHTKAVPAQGPPPMAPPSQPVPAQTPFRVEPATPVPDDVTSDSGESADDSANRLSHLPPPSPHWGHEPIAHGSYARVTVRKGPRPGAVVFGLLAMLVSAYVIAVNVSDASLEFRIVGPALIGALGGLLLLVGLAGVLIGRLRR